MGCSFKIKINKLNDQLTLTYLALNVERPALLIFIFHVLFTDDAAMKQHQVDPQQHITT